MDAYPLNLILAVVTASATIFLGFLPTKNIKSTFFAEQTILACFAWALVAVTSPHKVAHYPGMLAFLCFAAWWSFRKDHALSGKMWLSVASGLGISIGIMLILAVTPQANPPDLPELNKSLLLASIYLGGSIIGLAYACLVLVQNTKAGVTQGLIQRYVGLLPILTVIRAAVVAAESFLPGLSRGAHVMEITPFTSAFSHQSGATYLSPGPLVAVLPVLILVILAFLAQRATSFSSRIQPTRFLIAIMVVGFLTEILARLLVL